MKILSYIGPADYITLVNGLLGFLAIMYVIDYNHRLAFVFILVVIILDGIDGVVARFFRSGKQLGKYLDSISDTVSFGFAPAVLIYSIFYNLNYTSFNYLPNALVVFVCFMIVGFAMLRLAWFVQYGQDLDHFKGLPTPALALFIILVMQPAVQVYLSQTMTLTAIFIITLLTQTEFKYPKLDNILLQSVAGIAILILIASLVLRSGAVFSEFAIIIGFLFLLTYMILGPVYVGAREKHKLSTGKRRKNSE